MASQADFAATAPWRGIINKPAAFPTLPELIGQGGASNGNFLVWDQVKGRWIPTEFEPGSAVWGQISGILSDQTDLQAALDLKANTADLAVVAFTGDYDDLTNKPTALPPSGAAGGFLAGNYPNPGQNTSFSPQFAGITNTGFFTEDSIGYATGGNVQLRFDLGAYDPIGLTVNASFSPAGSSGMVIGRVQVLDLTNTTGAPLTLTWQPAWGLANGALPTSLAAGASIRVVLRCRGTTEASILASYYSSGSIPSGGAINQRLAKNSATNYDFKFVGPDVFNVADYGAQANTGLDQSTQINNAIVAALAYCAGYGAATVFFPNGIWYISSQIVATFGNSANLTICGTGRHGSIIVQLTKDANGIFVDMSNAGDAAINSRCVIQDLGFRTDISGATMADRSAGAAVTLTYGTGDVVFNPRNNQGSGVSGLHVEGVVGENGGWANGIRMINCWGSFIDNVEVYGGEGWIADLANPGLGAAGVGSGAAITYQGGTNTRWTSVYAQTWSQTFRIIPAGGVGSATLAPQGILIDVVDVVNDIEFLHCYPSSTTGGVDTLTLTNFQVDNGNNVHAERIGFYIEGAPGGGKIIVSCGAYLVSDATHFVLMKNSSVGRFFNIIFGTSGTVTIGIYLTGVSNVNMFNGCDFNNQPIQLDASAGLNQINNTGGSVVTNTGAGNLFSTTIF